MQLEPIVVVWTRAMRVLAAIMASVSQYRPGIYIPRSRMDLSRNLPQACTHDIADRPRRSGFEQRVLLVSAPDHSIVLPRDLESPRSCQDALALLRPLPLSELHTLGEDRNFGYAVLCACHVSVAGKIRSRTRKVWISSLDERES